MTTTPRTPRPSFAHQADELIDFFHSTTDIDLKRRMAAALLACAYEEGCRNATMDCLSIVQKANNLPTN